MAHTKTVTNRTHLFISEILIYTFIVDRSINLVYVCIVYTTPGRGLPNSKRSDVIFFFRLLISFVFRVCIYTSFLLPFWSVLSLAHAANC